MHAACILSDIIVKCVYVDLCMLRTICMIELETVVIMSAL